LPSTREDTAASAKLAIHLTLLDIAGREKERRTYVLAAALLHSTPQREKHTNVYREPE
jgi:hypothetical protein